MQEEDIQNVLLLVSGGPDSATLAKLAEKEYKEKGTTLNAIYLKTGHPSDDAEIEAANRVAEQLGARLEIIDVSDTVKALGNMKLMIHSEASIMKFGNAIVMSIAMAYCFQANYDAILVGLHKDDADENLEYTRPYMDQIESLASFAYPKSPKILTPFLDMTKVEVFKLGKQLGVDYSITWSCIRGEVQHCGICGACRARNRAFTLAGIEDPTAYESKPVALESVIGKSVQ